MIFAGSRTRTRTRTAQHQQHKVDIGGELQQPQDGSSREGSHESLSEAHRGVVAPSRDGYVCLLHT